MEKGRRANPWVHQSNKFLRLIPEFWVSAPILRRNYAG
jgi:hypothetical protein